jgi:hypothetical protein
MKTMKNVRVPFFRLILYYVAKQLDMHQHIWYSCDSTTGCASDVLVITWISGWMCFTICGNYVAKWPDVLHHLW